MLYAIVWGVIIFGVFFLSFFGNEVKHDNKKFWGGIFIILIMLVMASMSPDMNKGKAIAELEDGAIYYRHMLFEQPIVPDDAAYLVLRKQGEREYKFYRIENGKLLITEPGYLGLYTVPDKIPFCFKAVWLEERLAWLMTSP